VKGYIGFVSQREVSLVVDCNDCSEEIPQGDERIVDGVAYCESCFYDSFFYCDGCGEIFDRDEAYSGEHGIYCSECYNPPSFFSFKKVMTTNTDLMTKDAFGIEIECIGNDNHYIKSEPESEYFSAVDDGSLGEEGIEYVSVPLLFNKKSYQIIHNFTKALRRGHEIDARCGFHVHINLLPYISTQHSTTRQIAIAMKKLLVGYKKIEDYFFSIMPLSRQNNEFCRKLGDLKITNLIKKKRYDFLSYFYNQQIHDKRMVYKTKYPDCYFKRYYWVNCHALFYQNTLEIRLLGGTLNSRKIIMWTSINRKIVRHLLTHSIEEARNFSKDRLFQILNAKEKKFLIMREKMGINDWLIEKAIGDFFV